MSQEFSFNLSFDEFNLRLHGTPHLDGKPAEYAAKASEFFIQQFQGFGGDARVIVDHRERVIEVFWAKGPRWQEPQEKILDLIQRGRLVEAAPMMWTLVRQFPEDVASPFYAGLIFYALQQFDRAAEVLEYLIDVAPNHVYGLTALGIAESERGNPLIAEAWLTEALKLQPTNRFVMRNLGICLTKQRRFEEASRLLLACLQGDPSDVVAMIWLARGFEALGLQCEANEVYLTAILVDESDPVVEFAKQRLAEIAETRRQAIADSCSDVVVYIRDALERVSKMTPEQIQDLAFEIVRLNLSGTNLGDRSTKYRLNGLTGEFTAVQLVSLMYVAFQQLAPGKDVGIDLSKEYAAVLAQPHT
jgi:tetratricopeptide (TPR) repeat protein